MTLPMTESYRPLRVALTLWHPYTPVDRSAYEVSPLPPGANGVKIVGVHPMDPADIPKDPNGLLTIGDTKYQQFTEVDLTQYFIKFHTTNSCKTFWMGEIEFFDSSDTSLELISIFNFLRADNVLEITFGNDDAVFPSNPKYQGFVTFAQYDLKPNGVIITLTLIAAKMAGDLKTYGNKVPWNVSFTPTDSPGPQFVRLALMAGWIQPNQVQGKGADADVLAAAPGQASASPTAVTSVTDGAFAGYMEVGSGFGVRITNTTELASAGIAVIEGAEDYAPIDRQLGVYLSPEPGETIYEFMKRLAEFAVTPNGEPYYFFTTVNPNGSLCYHFHSESYAPVPKTVRPNLVYGDPATGVIDVHVESSNLYAALAGSVNASFSYVTTAQADKPAQPNKADTAAVTNKSAESIGTPGQVTVIGSKLEGSKPLLINPGNRRINAISPGKVEYTLRVDRWQAAYNKAARIIAEGRQFMFPIDITVVGRHDIDVFDIVHFEYSPRGAPGFVTGNYRILSVDHFFDTNGWVTKYRAFRDSVDGDDVVITLSAESQAMAEQFQIKSQEALDSIFQTPESIKSAGLLAQGKLFAALTVSVPPTAEETVRAIFHLPVATPPRLSVPPSIPVEKPPIDISTFTILPPKSSP